MKAIAWYTGWAALVVLVCMALNEPIPPPAKAARGGVHLEEVFHISRVCPAGGDNVVQGHWYLEKLEGETIIVACDYDEDGDE